MSTKFLAPLLLIAFIAVGCSSNSPTGSDENMSENANSQSNSYFDQNGKSAELSGLTTSEEHENDYEHDQNHNRRWHRQPVTFTVRIENVSTGSTLMLSNGETAPAPHSPGVWAVTKILNPLFKVNKYDLGIGMEQQAEDGDPTMLGQNIANARGVKSSGIFAIPVGDASAGPATPGKAFEFEVTAYPGDHLSFSTMFGQSNDLFYSPGRFGIPLFSWRGVPMNGDVTKYVRLWDAGTEVNQEPGLGADQAPRQSGPNTGESEHKRVRPVRDQYNYPKTNEVIKVTITPNLAS